MRLFLFTGEIVVFLYIRFCFLFFVLKTIYTLCQYYILIMETTYASVVALTLLAK
jgi:hypothetical protein